MLSALQPGTADADRPRGLGRRLILPVFSRSAKPAGQAGSALRLRSVLCFRSRIGEEIGTVCVYDLAVFGLCAAGVFP